jgi:hypothetical protein
MKYAIYKQANDSYMSHEIGVANTIEDAASLLSEVAGFPVSAQVQFVTVGDVTYSIESIED